MNNRGWDDIIRSKETRSYNVGLVTSKSPDTYSKRNLHLSNPICPCTIFFVLHFFVPLSFLCNKSTVKYLLSIRKAQSQYLGYIGKMYPAGLGLKGKRVWRHRRAWVSKWKSLYPNFAPVWCFVPLVGRAFRYAPCPADAGPTIMSSNGLSRAKKRFAQKPSEVIFSHPHLPPASGNHRTTARRRPGVPAFAKASAWHARCPR